MLTACGGGGKTNQKGASNEVEWEEGDLCALIFIGYNKDFSALAETDPFKGLGEKFPSLRKMTKFTVETEGDEVYYIIPRYKDATITVNEFRFDFDNMKEITGKELYRGGAEPVLIRCNISDIHPNTSVTVTGDGRKITFSPTSGAGDDIQHIGSLPGGMEETLPTSLPLEYTYQGSQANIRAKVIGGKVSLIFDREEAASILNESDFTPENSYVVELAGGSCKGVFIGNLGGENYPILCCLLEDGGVEVLDIHYALNHFDFSTSGRLPEHDDVVSVISDGLLLDDEEMYITLFAINSEGYKKEIMFCPMAAEYTCYEEVKGETMCYILELTLDWKIVFKSGYPNSEAHEFSYGRFWETRVEDDVFIYNYEMKEADRSLMTGEAPDPAVRTGSFKIQPIGEKFEYSKVTCVEGLKFHSGGYGKEAIFKKQIPFNLLTVDEGVVINGIKWATRNIAAPGTFAATPEDAGMFYRWNQKKAWVTTDRDDSIPAGDTWAKSNDPCPAGWRIPTNDEFLKLFDTNKVSSAWTTQNGVEGRKFTDKATGNAIFLPAAGYGSCSDGTLNLAGSQGDYWMSTTYSSDGAYGVYLYNGGVNTNDGEDRNFAFNVRPVAEN